MTKNESEDSGLRGAVICVILLYLFTIIFSIATELKLLRF